MPANESIPYRYKDGVLHFDSCVVYANYSSDTNLTIPCPNGWEYEHDSFTITEQVWPFITHTKYVDCTFAENVPYLNNNNHWTSDRWRIACFLENSCSNFSWFWVLSCVSFFEKCCNVSANAQRRRLPADKEYLIVGWYMYGKGKYGGEWQFLRRKIKLRANRKEPMTRSKRAGMNR